MLNENVEYSTVLVAEDDEVLQQLVRVVLRRSGYEVLLASNADEALQVVRNCQGQVDLLLTDMRMPGMSGSMLGSELQKEYPDTKVIYMTAYSAHEVEKIIPGETVIYKPFCLNHFSEVISTSLAESKRTWQSSC